MSTGNHLKNMAEEKCHKIEKCFSPKSCKKQVSLTGSLTTLEQKRFQNFLNSMGFNFEFDLRSFNYSMPQEGSSEFMGL